jgi:hypothetical protein
MSAMNRLVGRFVLGFGVLVLVLAGMMAGVTGGRFMINGEKARGIVVALEDDGESFYPIVEFVTHAGEPRRHKGLGASEAAYRVGQYVAIRYIADDPNAAAISSSFQELWLGATVVGVFGAVLTGIGLLLGRRRR